MPESRGISRQSPEGQWDQFHHGTGIGDVNGDGRLDLLLNDGWWEQPAERGTPWLSHPVVFSRDKGGAQMFAYDVNGDGLADVITSLNAHGWELAWFEQVKTDDGMIFKEHKLMGDRSEEAKFGVFSQPTRSRWLISMAMAYRTSLSAAHVGITAARHRTDAAPVLYWFQLSVTD